MASSVAIQPFALFAQSSSSKSVSRSSRSGEDLARVTEKVTLHCHRRLWVVDLVVKRSTKPPDYQAC